jgi:membrane associated rhomboid family serine protease
MPPVLRMTRPALRMYPHRRHMARFRSVQLSFPDFSGVTRALVIWNLVAYFLLQLAIFARLGPILAVFGHLALSPDRVVAGEVWQPLTYSLVHANLVGTLLELLSLWFLAGFLESMHTGRWLFNLYAVSVLGGALTAVLIYGIGTATGHPQPAIVITGCLGGIFGLLTAIGVLHGDVEFQMMFVIGIKARYLAIIYALVAFALTFGEQRMYAFAELGAGLAAILYIRLAPSRGFGFRISETWYGLRNQYFRWKRRRAASKFQVYMKKQGRTVRFDGQGRLIDEDDQKHNDRARWN